jgi:hypothetical protein
MCTATDLGKKEELVKKGKERKKDWLRKVGKYHQRPAEQKRCLPCRRP